MKLNDKNYRKAHLAIARKIAKAQVILDGLRCELYTLGTKHNHRGPMTMTGSMNKKMGFKKIERICRVCEHRFIEKRK